MASPPREYCHGSLTNSSLSAQGSLLAKEPPCRLSASASVYELPAVSGAELSPSLGSSGARFRRLGRRRNAFVKFLSILVDDHRWSRSPPGHSRRLVTQMGWSRIWRFSNT